MNRHASMSLWRQKDMTRRVCKRAGVFAAKKTRRVLLKTRRNFSTKSGSQLYWHRNISSLFFVYVYLYRLSHHPIYLFLPLY